MNDIYDSYKKAGLNEKRPYVSNPESPSDFASKLQLRRESNKDKMPYIVKTDRADGNRIRIYPPGSPADYYVVLNKKYVDGLTVLPNGATIPIKKLETDNYVKVLELGDPNNIENQEVIDKLKVIMQEYTEMYHIYEGSQLTPDLPLELAVSINKMRVGGKTRMCLRCSKKV